MIVVLSLIVAGLYAAGVYMLLRRSVIKMLIGLVLIGNAANVMILSVSRFSRGGTPIIPQGQSVLPRTASDPVPQALILTAIVIGFGVLAFALALAKRVCDVMGTDDLDEMNPEEAEQVTP
jgi:multicomponent Na+:H+ antiporter subunit C